MNDMSSRMGLKSSKHSQTSLPDPSLPFSAAGILFSNETHVLAGYQPHKSTPCITGIGGTRNEGEYALQTAWRETLEELFNINPDKELITIINLNIIHKKLCVIDNYYILTYTFEDLELILQLLNKKNITSNLYDTFPSTIYELIFNRKIDSKNEISHLCLLPLKENVIINNDFIKDINYFLAQK